MLEITGNLTANPGHKYAIVASRFNSTIVDRLIDGCEDTLTRHGVSDGNITLVKVPGAWELPVVAERLARSGEYCAVIALGTVIRGATPHFDYVCAQAASGLQSTAVSSGVPILFGVLTTDTIDQAVERSGTKAGNKGEEAALAALEMADLMTKLLQAQTARV